MNEQGLVSSYNVPEFKPHAKTCNESVEANELDREFKQDEQLKAIVRDLTYVRIDKKCICVFVDLFNREIIGCSTDSNKDALLVYRALASIMADLHQV
jgi:putative transposase